MDRQKQTTDSLNFNGKIADGLKKLIRENPRGIFRVIATIDTEEWNPDDHPEIDYSRQSDKFLEVEVGLDALIKLYENPSVYHLKLSPPGGIFELVNNESREL